MKTQNTLLVLALFITSLSFGQTNTFPATGNVGIGTTTDNNIDKLQVNGSILSEGSISSQGLKYGKSLLYTGDLNDLVASGFYDGVNLANAPTTGWFYYDIQRFNGNNDWVKQTATGFGSQFTTGTYVRNKTDQGWQPWRRLLDSSNLTNLINGTGSTNYIPRFTGSGTIENGSLIDTGNGRIGIDTPYNSGKINTWANDYTTILSTTRSDNTQPGKLLFDGWGNYAFNKKLVIGGESIDITSYSEMLYVNGNALFNTGNDSTVFTKFSNDRLRVGYLNSVTSLPTNLQDAQIIMQGGGAENLFIASRGNSPSSMTFHTSAGSNIVERMKITSDGKVGIGATDPAAKLEVAGDAKINGMLNISGANALNFSSYGGGFYMGDDSWIRTFGDKNFYHNTGIMRTDGIFHIGGNGDRFIVTQDGKVGIGTTTPAAKLHIQNAGTNGQLDYNLIVQKTNVTDSDKSAVGILLSTECCGSFGKSAIVHERTGGYGIGNLYFLNNNKNDSSIPSLSDVKMTINSNGNVGIGTTIPDEKLTINGTIHATEVKVTQTVPADYVFQKYYTGKSELKSDYVMPTLAEIENFAKKNNHLPNVPSAKEIQQKGVSLGEMSNILLQKVEELTLYAIEQNKLIEFQQNQNNVQSKEIETLKKENDAFKELSKRIYKIENQLKY